MAYVDLAFYTNQPLQSVAFPGWEYEYIDTLSEHTGQAAAVTVSRMYRKGSKTGLSSKHLAVFLSRFSRSLEDAILR